MAESTSRFRHSLLMLSALAVLAGGLVLQPVSGTLPAQYSLSTTSSSNNMVRPRTGIKLIEPLMDDTSAFNNNFNGIEIIFVYFRGAWPWLFGTAAGIGVLMALIGGIEIMFSGGDSTMRQKGTDKLLWSLAGLMIIILTGFILRVLNPLFYSATPPPPAP